MRFSAALCLIPALSVPGASLIAGSCEDLLKLTLPNTSITMAASQAAGDFTPPAGQTIHNLPAFCRVAGSIRPSADSDIRFEAWLPGSGWNGKFQGVGNGGFAGSISYSGLADAVAKGYATASTDTGHEANGTDATWAIGHPEKIADFGYRAIHETAGQAKAIIRVFYGQSPRRSYFNSCSNGGRQALMEAQRFPGDYDGIIAGAPANYWTHLLTGAAWDMRATLAEAASYIAAAKLPAIQAAALAQCDALDGVKDGVIEDPRQCHFNPEALLCNGPESDRCLTSPELSALKAIYGGPRDSRGKHVFPGYSPGGEAEPGGWGAWITGQNSETKPLMYLFGTQFFKNMVFNNPNWDFKTFDVDRDMKTADAKAARLLNATNPDLGAFRKRGGKLILYHGWSDAAIPGLNTVEYYENVVLKMGRKDSAGFVRLFMVPGMEHCGGGAAPNVFGQGGASTGDPVHDIDSALEHWVEQGIAPAKIVATRFKTNGDPSSEVVRTHPLCPFPEVARWKGTGSTDDAANFTCVAQDGGK
jgi:feruloyl esterase